MVDRLRDVAARFWGETVLGNTSDVGSQPAPIAAVNEMTSPYGLHSILKHNQYDPDAGLFHSDSSAAFCFGVTAQTSTNDDMASRLNTLFTPMSPRYGIQWCLFDNPVLDGRFQAYVDQHRIVVDSDKATPFFQELAKRRMEYIYKTRDKPLWPNDSYVVKDVRLLFSITKAGSFHDTKLMEEMCKLHETVRASLRAAGLPSLPLSTDGLTSFP